MKLTKIYFAVAIGLGILSLPALADNTATPASASPAITAEQISQAVQQGLTGLGFTSDGYLRSGFYSGAGNDQKGQYQLGGDLQHYRLGNEGDTYIEVGVGKRWDAGNGVKWGVYAMPSDYNGTYATKQAWAYITGLPFAPDAMLWAGQRYHRIQDIHILDNWLMQDGDDYGAGIDGIKVGAAKLNFSASSAASEGTNGQDLDNARRANFQILGIPTNAGGTLDVTGAVVTGDFAIGKQGGAFGLLHNQKDFIIAGLNNSLFLQTSSGHADINGEFYGLDASNVAQAGAQQNRIAEVINWQEGRFGGQALVGYQTVAQDHAAKYRDSSVGGRVSYGLSDCVKLLVDVGLTARDTDGAAAQHLNKETVAIAFAPSTDFWSRPEFRLYASHFNWNDAAGIANLSTFGANGKTEANTVGAQIEAWW